MSITQADIEKKIKNEKEQSPNIINYYFGCFANTPQYVVLLYSPKENSIIKEYIKVKNYGLHFHDKFFNTLKELITWFKEEFKNEAYRKYVRRVKPPF